MPGIMKVLQLIYTTVFWEFLVNRAAATPVIDMSTTGAQSNDCKHGP